MLLIVEARVKSPPSPQNSQLLFLELPPDIKQYANSHPRPSFGLSPFSGLLMESDIFTLVLPYSPAILFFIFRIIINILDVISIVIITIIACD